MRSNYKWYVLAASFFLSFTVVSVTIFALPIFYPYLTKAFGWQRTETVLAGSMFQLPAVFFSVLVGWMCERFGVRPILTIGLLATVLSVWQLSLVKSLFAFYAVAFGMGIGSLAMGDLPNQFLLVRWFDRRLGISTGIMLSSVNASIIVSPPLTNFLIKNFGWRHAADLMAIASLILPLALILLVVRERPEGSVSSLQAKPSLSRINCSHDSKSSSAGGGVADLLRSPTLWLIAIPIFIGGMAQLGVINHSVLFLLDNGFSMNRAASVVSLMGVGGLLGTIVFGLLCDKALSKTIFLGYCLFAIMLVFLILISKVAASSYIIALVYGASVGGFQTFIPLLVRNNFEEKSFGSAFGVVRSSYLLGGTIGPGAAGLILKVTGSYAAFFLLMGSLVGVAAMIILRLLFRPAAIQNAV
jgi:sugar phosphate permease